MFIRWYTKHTIRSTCSTDSNFIIVRRRDCGFWRAGCRLIQCGKGTQRPYEASVVSADPKKSGEKINVVGIRPAFRANLIAVVVASFLLLCMEKLKIHANFDCRRRRTCNYCCQSVEWINHVTRDINNFCDHFQAPNVVGVELTPNRIHIT